MVGRATWGCQIWPLARSGARRPLARYRTVIPRSSATHTQIFSLLPCCWAGFLFLGFGPPPGLFSQNAPAGRHTHALRYPHANFQPPSMSLGWIFIWGFWPPGRPLGFFHKTHPQVVIPMPSATHMQIFSILECRSAGFLFLGFWPPGRPLGFFRQTHPQVVIPMPFATHMQIFSLLACRSAGFLFLAPWPPPWLFSQNAPAGRHSHAISYPHANFQLPTMSFAWLFFLGVLAPWPAPLAFFTKRTHKLSFPYHQLHTCKFSAS